MSDINLIIEKAADKLTKNERKNKSKKENYTESELRTMLILQRKQRDDNREGLEKKLLDLCEKTQREFNISHISVGMMHNVALQISKDISNETITSVQNVEKSGGVKKALKEEATKIQLIENYEAFLDGRKIPHENIPFYSDSIKLIVSAPEIAEALNKLNSENEADKDVNKILKDFNKNNADAVAISLTEVMKSDNFKRAEKEHAKNVCVILQHAEKPEEKRIACEEAEHQETAARCRLDPKNKDAFISLMYKYMTRLNLKNAPIDRIIADMKLNLLSNTILTAEQRTEVFELINELEKSNKPQNMLDYLAERIAELNPKVKKESIIEAAKKAAEADVDISRIDQNFLKSQARILFSDDEHYIEYCDLANAIYSLEENPQEIDWDKVQGINEVSSDLYAMTLAALTQKTKTLEDGSYFEKTQDLVEKYVSEEKYTVRDDKIYMDSKKMGRAVAERSYWEFSRNAMDNPDKLENIKKSRIELIRKLDYLTPEEKEEEIRKIEQIETVEDAIEFGVEGISKEKTRQGKKADQDKIRENLIGRKPKTRQEEIKADLRRASIDQKAEASASLKVTTIQPQYRERYEELMRTLGCSKKRDDIELDNELLDYLRDNEPSCYKMLCEKYSQTNNASLKDAIERRVKKEEREKMRSSKVMEEPEKSAEEKSRTMDEDAEELESKKAVQAKKIEDAIVIDGEKTPEVEEVVEDEEKSNVLQAVGDVLQDVVSTLADPSTLMDTANPIKKVEEERDR